MKTVYATSLTVQTCCARCRKPADRCTDADCATAPRYSGMLLRSEWVPSPIVHTTQVVGVASTASLQS